MDLLGRIMFAATGLGLHITIVLACDGFALVAHLRAASLQTDPCHPVLEFGRVLPLDRLLGISQATGDHRGEILVLDEGQITRLGCDELITCLWAMEFPM